MSGHLFQGNIIGTGGYSQVSSGVGESKHGPKELVGVCVDRVFRSEESFIGDETGELDRRTAVTAHTQAIPRREYLPLNLVLFEKQLGAVGLGCVLADACSELVVRAVAGRGHVSLADAVQLVATGDFGDCRDCVDGRPVVAGTGRLTARCGQEYLALSQGLNIMFHLVGRGNHGDDLGAF